jgi:class 3 adenylate cyclase
MEENICILMSDLSGYTALTETHGAVSAADLIERYIEIVEECLVGDCHLQERTGDEVMIVSSNPDSLLATAAKIMDTTSKEHNFLQVHGGLHYGKALKRGNSYYGSTINLTSRIAAKASPGTYWCSRVFIESLSDMSQIKVQAMGQHTFKNINGYMEMYELKGEVNSSFYIDSVCRMLILDTARAIRHPTIEGIFFCSPACLEIYLDQIAGPEVQ